MGKPIILGIGGAHIDRRGQVAGDFVPGASNPGTMGEDVGGGTFNALRNAVNRGATGWMMSVRGGDAAGAAVARAISDAGIRDLSVTFLDRGTPSYTAILSRDGDVLAALADMGLYEIAFPRQMRRASLRVAAHGADAVLCDANLPQQALARVPELADGKPIFAIAISPAKAARLAGILPHLACLFLNTREAGVLSGLGAEAGPAEMIAALREKGVTCAVITQGAERVLAFDADRILAFTPPRAARVVDVTGAGDALAGATVAALLAGVPLGEAVRHGMAAALLAVQSASCVPELPAAGFAAALALVPEGRALHQGTSPRVTHVA